MLALVGFPTLSDAFTHSSGSGIERGIGALMSKAGITLLYKLLKYDPEDRITARLALRSEWCQAYKLHKKGQKGS